MSSIALPLTNVVLGLVNVGAGIGFGVEEQKKMDYLNKISEQLKNDATVAGDLYDHVYYLVAVNLDRVKNAIDQLPSDFLEKVNTIIESDLQDSNAQSALKVLGSVLGYTATGVGVIGGILQLVIKLREKLANGEQPEQPSEDPFDIVPLDGEEPLVPVESESSLPASPKLTKFANGLNIAGIVFGVGGLAITITLDVWTLEKLNKAISDVEKKQDQVSKFQKALESALNDIITAAGLDAKDYDSLPALAKKWKEISENFDSYEKSMYYAIKGYFDNDSEVDIKKTVDSKSDAGKPFPDDGYPLAKTLADDIKYLFKQKKTDKEVVAFFATENPKLGLRFVFDEFFISSLRW